MRSSPELQGIRFDLVPSAKTRFQESLVIDLAEDGHMNIEVVCSETPWCEVCRRFYHWSSDNACPARNKSSTVENGKKSASNGKLQQDKIQLVSDKEKGKDKEEKREERVIKEKSDEGCKDDQGNKDKGGPSREDRNKGKKRGGKVKLKAKKHVHPVVRKKWSYRVVSSRKGADIEDHREGMEEGDMGQEATPTPVNETRNEANGPQSLVEEPTRMVSEKVSVSGEEHASTKKKRDGSPEEILEDDVVEIRDSDTDEDEGMSEEESTEESDEDFEENEGIIEEEEEEEELVGKMSEDREGEGNGKGDKDLRQEAEGEGGKLEGKEKGVVGYLDKGEGNKEEMLSIWDEDIYTRPETQASSASTE
ncbi:hypothetical protein CBR_g26166 [Chara braunii]|uniref:Uncharacterized protein n=1 Tax=Chara braunii TaxID=69332 RepID=A0A388L749_CHABU|nr:hypothetical protein CBR_g26166 [Chara braunii]|eukprot:GBG78129.1 hypothetical protein CBR_g26166 [Chara braunii]